MDMRTEFESLADVLSSEEQHAFHLKPWCSRAKILLRLRAARAAKRKTQKLEQITLAGGNAQDWLNSQQGEAWEEEVRREDSRMAAQAWLGATREELAGLQQRFPAIKLSSRLGPDDLKFWKKNLCVNGTPVTLPDLVDGLLKHPMLDAETPHLSVSLVSMNGKGLQVQISSNDETGGVARKEGSTTADPNAQPFSCIVEFSAGGKPGAPHAKLVSVQAKNRGRQVMAQSLLPCMKALNVQRFTLDASGLASSRDGCLAWARYGFEPPQDTWDDMRREGLERIGNEAAAIGEGAGELLQALHDANPATLKRLMALTWKYRSKDKDALSALTKFVNSLIPMSWPGTIDLGDPACEKWITSYAKGSTDVDFFALLPDLPKAPSLPPPKKKDIEAEAQDEPEGKATKPDPDEVAVMPAMMVEWAAGDPASQQEIADELLSDFDKKYTSEAIAMLLDATAEGLPAAIVEGKLTIDESIIGFFASILGRTRTDKLFK